MRESLGVRLETVTAVLAQLVLSPSLHCPSHVWAQHCGLGALELESLALVDLLGSAVDEESSVWLELIREASLSVARDGVLLAVFNYDLAVRRQILQVLYVWLVVALAHDLSVCVDNIVQRVWRMNLSNLLILLLRFWRILSIDIGTFLL